MSDTRKKGDEVDTKKEGVMSYIRNRIRDWADERGITGLETAIVLIAFVVVASVFAFAVLSTGLLSSEKSKETVLGGLEETQSTISLRGSVIAHASTTGATGTVQRIVFEASNATQGGEGIDLSSSAVVVTYIDTDQVENLTFSSTYPPTADLTWATDWLNGSSPILDSDERVEFSIRLSGLPSRDLSTSEEFTIQVKPSRGTTMIVNRRTPAELTTVVNLN